MLSYNYNIKNTNILPTANVELSAAAKYSTANVKILVTDKSMPMCSVCLSLPENPVTICKSIETNFFKKHLLCRKCAISNNCPVCRQKSPEGLQPEPSATTFIEHIKLNSLYLCPNNCNVALRASEIGNHIINCSEQEPCIQDITSEDSLSICSVVNSESIARTTTLCTDCKNYITITKAKKHKKKCPQAMVTITKKTSAGMNIDFTVRRWLCNNKLRSFFTKCKLEYANNFKNRSNHVSTRNFSLSTLNKSGCDIFLDFETLAKNPTDRKTLIKYNNKILINARDKSLSIVNKGIVILDFYDIPNKYKYTDQYGNTHLHFYKHNFTVAISANIADGHNHIVCKKKFNLAEVSSYNHIYNNNAAPQDFIDLIEFFTANGIAQKYYVEKYGACQQWQIIVKVEDA